MGQRKEPSFVNKKGNHDINFAQASSLTGLWPWVVKCCFDTTYFINQFEEIVSWYWKSWKENQCRISHQLMPKRIFISSSSRVATKYRCHVRSQNAWHLRRKLDVFFSSFCSFFEFRFDSSQQRELPAWDIRFSRTFSQIKAFHFVCKPLQLSQSVAVFLHTTSAESSLINQTKNSTNLELLSKNARVENQIILFSYLPYISWLSFLKIYWQLLISLKRPFWLL